MVWDIAKGKLHRTYACEEILRSCGWSPNGEWMVAGAQEKTLQIWNVASGENTPRTGYSGKVSIVRWTSDSRWLVTTSSNGIIAWDFSNGTTLNNVPKIFSGHAGNVSALAVQRVEACFASGGEEGRLAIWSLGEKSAMIAGAPVDDSISVLNWSSDDKNLAVGSSGGTVTVF